MPATILNTSELKFSPPVLTAITDGFRVLVAEGRIPGAVSIRDIAEASGTSLRTSQQAVQAGVGTLAGVVKLPDVGDIRLNDKGVKVKYRRSRQSAEAWEWDIENRDLARGRGARCAPIWRDLGQTARYQWELLRANPAGMTAAETASRLDVTVRTVNRSATVLVDAGAIEKVGRSIYRAIYAWTPDGAQAALSTITVSDGLNSWEYTGTLAECAVERHNADRTRMEQGVHH